LKTVQYLYALLLSESTPLIKKLRNDSSKNKVPSKDFHKTIFGVDETTLRSWLQERKDGPKRSTIERLCASFKEFRENNDIAFANSEEFVEAELYDENWHADSGISTERNQGHEARWFNFAKKLGYEVDNEGWKNVQNSIESTLYKRNIRGHEFSCNEHGIKQIENFFSGINYLYFIASVDLKPTLDSEYEKRHALIRATLRIRPPVQAANTKAIKYIPCRLKFDTPLKNSTEWITVEYVGQATYRDEYLYLMLVDDSSITPDYVHISIKHKSSFDHLYAGMYSSVSGAEKRPYSSVVILDHRQYLMQGEEILTPDATLNFMYGNTKYFLSNSHAEHPAFAINAITNQPTQEDDDYDTNKYIGLSENQKIAIKRLLSSSPFAPPTEI